MESEKALEADCKSLSAEVDSLKQMLLEEKKKNQNFEEKVIINMILITFVMIHC